MRCKGQDLNLQVSLSFGGVSRPIDFNASKAFASTPSTSCVPHQLWCPPSVYHSATLAIKARLSELSRTFMPTPTQYVLWPYSTLFSIAANGLAAIRPRGLHRFLSVGSRTRRSVSTPRSQVLIPRKI